MKRRMDSHGGPWEPGGRIQILVKSGLRVIQIILTLKVVNGKLAQDPVFHLDPETKLLSPVEAL